jgi:hypothetical protein
LSVKCSVTRCDNQTDGFCTIIPIISDESFDVQAPDEIVGEMFPVCQSIETKRKEKEYIEKRYKEIHEDSIKIRHR